MTRTLSRLGFIAIALGIYALIDIPSAIGVGSNNSRQPSVVRVKRGDQNGSGVIIKELDQGYVIVTSNHVLTNAGPICIASANGSKYVANRIGKENARLDVALLWIPKVGKQEVVANVGSRLNQKIALPLASIVATGYPDKQSYSEREGIIVPLLPFTLEDGYNLTYTSTIEKGMSGGGVFNDRDILIGINGMHSQPLWSAELKDSRGRVIPSILARRLETVSIGTSLAPIMKEMNSVLPSKVPAAWRKQAGISECKF